MYRYPEGQKKICSVPLKNRSPVYQGLQNDYGQVGLNKKALPEEVTSAVLAFIIFYIIVFALGSILLAAMDIEFDTAIGAVATSLGNVGPGISDVGPAYTFNFLPDAAKWELAFLMLVGRLELFTVLMLLTPWYWKRS